MCIEVNCVFIQLPTQSKVTFVLPAGGPAGGGGPGQQQSTKDSSAKLRTTVGQERTYRGRCNRLMQVGCERKLECMCELQSGELCSSASPSSHLQPAGLEGKLTTILRCNIKAKFNEHVGTTRHFMYRKK